MTCLAVRLMLEFSAATWTALRTTERLVAADAASLPEIAAKVDRLVSGARFPVALPRGGVTTTSAINVETFMKTLEKARPGTLEDYAFLSAGSHPCHLQQLWLHLAGATGDNWSNELFAAHAHEVLGRVVKIGDYASKGLAADTARIAATLGPQLARHRTISRE